MLKNCEYCGQQFEAKQERRTTCSPSCRMFIQRGTTLTLKVCVYCGDSYKPSRSDQQQCVSQRNGGCPKRYPSEYERQCVVCDKSFIAASPLKTTCSHDCRKIYVHPPKEVCTKSCPVCGESFEVAGSHNKKFCSRQCKRKDERQNPAHIAWMKEYARQYKGRIKSKQCPECLEYGVKADSTYCSVACSKASRLSKCTDLVLWQPKSKREPKQYVPAKRSFVMGHCQECAEQFTQVRRGNMKPATYCSDRCARRAAWRDQAHIRRARIKHSRRGNVHRRAILERDNYTCKLCNEPVDMTAHYNDNAYPSLDHIIPLARGGWHGMDNIQTAHRICNSIKSDSLHYAS